VTQLEALQQQVKEVRAEVKLLREAMTQMALAGQRLEARVRQVEATTERLQHAEHIRNCM